MYTLAPFPRRRFLRMLGAGAVSLHASGATAKPLRGIFPIAQTPFTDADKLDLEVLAGHVRFLDRVHVHGCVWPQNASEWSTLTEAERLAGAEVVCSVGVKLQPAVVIGVQAPDIQTAVKYAKHAARNGADALISLPPSGAGMPALIEYYKAVGGATGLPLFAQAVGDFRVDHLIEIYRAVPTLRYIKDEAGQPLLRFPILKQKSGGEINVFSGGGKNLLDEMIRGFSGCMPFAAFADLHAAVWDLWHEGKQREAMDLFGKAAILMEEVATYGLDVVKYILCRRGVFKNFRTRGGKSRMPLDDRSQQAVAQILDLMRPYLRA